MDEIDNAYKFLMKNLEQLESTGWITDKVAKGISIKYKFPPGTSTVSLMMETELEADITKLMALISEVDLFPRYVPFCFRANLI